MLGVKKIRDLDRPKIFNLILKFLYLLGLYFCN